ncbi:MAG: phosphoenolpyruvate carboxykinase (GTP) [Actinomycetota bacterium]|nr:phosphoenolpyruvate carboxykinase (GTP) [Actinomycetota bacterium]
MGDSYLDFLRDRLDSDHYDKIAALDNHKLFRFVAEAIELCDPETIYICTDDKKDVDYVRKRAVARGEESELAIPGHTVHYDGFHDQARDKKNTKYLLPRDVHLGEHINSMERESGLKEVLGLLEDAMAGKEMLVRFFCLGPKDSIFSQLCCQITDSFYVAHSEDLLYRQGYDEFEKAGAQADFFRFLHSAGELVDGVSANVEGRRVYIDLEENAVYSTNTQYGGNTMGLKKLAMRLGIQKGLREGWLTEHMFIVGVPDGDHSAYLTGAFPSACGKTSTAMLPGQTIVGDDIAYVKKIDGEVRAVNVEKGIFGIIQDVNPDDDPVIYKALNSPAEVIFSNVLMKDGKPYWLGMGQEIPENGYNYAGKWVQGDRDKDGNEITPSHKNARYTLQISELENCDPHLNDPAGVPIGGMIFGGRDSDTTVPVEESFDWAHGVITKAASLESETTAATLGEEGVRKFNPMSNLDFLAASLDTYILKYLEFATELESPPRIFGVNYFLRDKTGGYLNGMMDKRVWIYWIVKRIHGEVRARVSPTGFIPVYTDLRRYFRDILEKHYTDGDYEQQFTIRVPEQISKLDRIEGIYRKEWGIPELVMITLSHQRQRLEEARSELGDYISPFDLPEEDEADAG